MGKIKDWLIEMKEDATTMTRDEWVDKHGESVIDVYNDFHIRKDGNAPEQENLFGRDNGGEHE